MTIKYFSIYTLLTLLLISEVVAQDIQKGEGDFGAIKCGTFLPEEKNKDLIDKIMIYTVPRITGMQRYYDSPSGCFRIHYDISNPDTIKNAVDLIDKNSNGVPDYVDSVAYYADYAYNYYVNEYDYFPPCPDNGRGGSEQYDIYLVDMGNGKEGGTFYGMTYQEGEILPRRTFERFYSFLLLDNNYSSLDSTLLSDGKMVRTFKYTGIEGMKVTCVHELHHAIQFKYGNPSPRVAMFNELTSTYYESEIFPEIPDYLQYVKNLFNDLESMPFGDGKYLYGYSWSIFGQYMSKKWNQYLLKRCWELIYDGIPTYRALDSAFKERSTTLSDAWCEFLPWLYYTGDRAFGSRYFDDAEIFPMMNFYRDEMFSTPAFTDNSQLSPFEVRGFRCYFNSDEDFATDDTLDFIMTNTDLESAIIQSKKKTDYSFIVTDSQHPDMIRMLSTNYYYSLISESPTFCNRFYLEFGSSTDRISTAFPSPYRHGIDEAIFFPAPKKAEIYDEVEIRLYSADMLEIYSMKLPVTVRNSLRVLRWDEIPDIFESGVYIFSTKYGSDQDLGKFTIIR
jgi:hypothetical protein